jgi:hypothetical protein
MDCVNHSGVSATAYCQNCGKPLCADCVRKTPGGQILCDPCWRAWQSFQSANAGLPPHGPSPALAAFLGLIPGVGAMYNGQFCKGFIHVFVFAVLVSLADNYSIFGLLITAWIFYQVFEAYQTAKALRYGEPLPDPLGLNEVANWLNPGARLRNSGQPGAGQAPANSGTAASGPAGPEGEGCPPPNAGPYQTPSQQAPGEGSYPAPPTPSPAENWRRKEPVGAIVLIGLGVLFLLGQLDIFHGRFMEFAWPVLLIALGVWLIVRRSGEMRGGSK